MFLFGISEAPFDAKTAKLSLSSSIEQEYLCANNLFLSDLLFNVDPNVLHPHIVLSEHI